MATNQILQQQNTLEELLRFDELPVRAMVEDASNYFDDNGLTVKAQTLLNDTDILFSYQPKRQVLRFDDKRSYTDIQALLEVYSTWNPYEEITREAVDAALDKYNVTDEQLRRMIPHVANVIFVEHAVDDNGNPITPSRITDYNADELQWLVSYDRPVGPYEHYGRGLIDDPDKQPNQGEIDAGLSSWYPIASSNHGWVWQSIDQTGNVTSPFLLAQEILSSGQYEHVSEDAMLAALEQILDWERKNMRHHGVEDIPIYEALGYPPPLHSRMPPEVILSFMVQGKFIGGSHQSAGGLSVPMLRNLNIPAMELHVRNNPQENSESLYAYSGHGYFRMFLGGRTLVSAGNFAYAGCYKDISVNLLVVDEEQFSALMESDNLAAWREKHAFKVNPECAQKVYG
ncbi:MAG: hypothetical protein O6914_02615 [Chloroflexi bacterium]|nr:hypothetical protein [Chloroflexota bacterium]